MLTIDQYARALAVNRLVLSDAFVRGQKNTTAQLNLFALFNPFLFWMLFFAT